MLPDYEREKLNAEILLNKAAYGACLRIHHGIGQLNAQMTVHSQPPVSSNISCF
jgi:hypothetical protein